MGEPTHNSPTLPTRTIGRAKIITSLASDLPRWRFITPVGPGDIGKTTVALPTAEALAARCSRCAESLR